MGLAASGYAIDFVAHSSPSSCLNFSKESFIVGSGMARLRRSEKGLALVNFGFALALFRKFTFDGDFEVAFGGAFGEDGQSGFAANFHTKFQGHFFDFDALG